jgi:glycine cleavage system regulatory protein
MSVIARDRPGVVEAIAGAVKSQSGNWVDSSMARLAGEFAGIVRVEIPEKNEDALKDALTALGSDGIDVTVRTGDPSDEAKGTLARLELTGLDHPGIVLEVTRTLAANDVNIVELNTAVNRGSMGAEPMFTAQADIVLPENLSRESLQDALEEIARDMMVDIDLSAP